MAYGSEMLHYKIIFIYVFFSKKKKFLPQWTENIALYLRLIKEACYKESTCQFRWHRSCRFDPWVRKVPWNRKWQPAPVLLPGESHGQRDLVGYSPWDHKELDTWLVTKQQKAVVQELDCQKELLWELWRWRFCKMTKGKEKSMVDRELWWYPLDLGRKWNEDRP